MTSELDSSLRNRIFALGARSRSRLEKTTFKRTHWLLLKNPWNLTEEQKERLSTLVRWNTPIVRAYYLKESLRYLGCTDRRSAPRISEQVDAFRHAFTTRDLQEICPHAALPSQQNFTETTTIQRSVEGMNNKIESISHRSFGFRNAQYFIAAIYHGCARLPLPEEI